MADGKSWSKSNDSLTPGSSRNIPKTKIKAFNIGTVNLPGKGKTKREQEEIRKKEDKEAAAKVYEEFVASFEDTGKQLNKSWVKGGTFNSEKKDSGSRKEESRIYKPTSKLAELVSEFSSTKKKSLQDEARPMYKPAIVPGKKREKEKKKSNLEIFKEELKSIQEEREERHRLRHYINEVEEPPGRRSRFEPPDPPPLSDIVRTLGLDDKPYQGYENDTTTTNLYLGNISPNMTEQQLCELFGRHGPLASVKIMWPRSEEERARGRNCGFVAFMNRQDGERALDNLKGQEIMGFEMKLGWGKPVPIPPIPIYIPPALAELSLPPPPSGMPFNAQASKQSREVDDERTDKSYGCVPPPKALKEESRSQENGDYDKTLSNAVVKVVIPTERNLLSVIHRMIEFVVREGPMFEAMIMNRELHNPMFRFLFENQSPAHVYYRWKLYSILQGDTPTRWCMSDFKMFKTGSIWRPPAMNQYTQGMNEAVKEEKRRDEGTKRGQLTESQRDRLEDTLRELNPTKSKIGEAMVWCLDHAEAAEEIVECITESLSIIQTPIPKKIARLFLVSDVLHNCGAKVRNASFFRKYFNSTLPEIFKDLHEAHDGIEGRLKAEQFKQKVMACFRAWEDWALYPNDFLIKLQNIFLGLIAIKSDESSEEETDDLDGAPIPIDGNVLNHSRQESKRPDDVDGVPLDDIDGMPLRNDDNTDSDDVKPEPIMIQPAFKPSKWETIDPEEVEAQAMTTSKWEILEDPKDKFANVEDYDGKPMDDSPEQVSWNSMSTMTTGLTEAELAAFRPTQEERRTKLREIELKVMKYQDELEAGKRSRKMQLSISQQVETYRQKLLQKEKDKEEERIRDKIIEKKREDEQRKVKEWERAREKQKAREKSKKNRDRSSSSDSSPSRERDRRRRDADSPIFSTGSKSSKSKHRSRSGTPKKSKRSRSRSRSPSSKKHKHKKSKR